MKIFFFSLCFFFLSVNVIAQKAKADSVAGLLAKEKTDTNRVLLMCLEADLTYTFDPVKALTLSEQALFLADKIKYLRGKSTALSSIGTTFYSIGNYPRSLEYYYEALKLEEKRDKPFNMARVLMEIGIVYGYQEEYGKAREYYYKSDSVIELYHIESLKYYILQDLGDVYDRLNNTDSAYHYFNKSLGLANDLHDDNLVGAAMTGLGHTYRKQEKYVLAQANYQSAISYLRASNNDDLLCEATLGLAKLYQKINHNDSATYYARQSLSIAQHDGFRERELEAAEFLTDHFKGIKRFDSAFSYSSYVKELNDTINSKSRIRESQVISSNEQLREIEKEENKKIARRERDQALQLLFIGIFIPGFFLFTLLLSRIKIHVRVIKILGVLSLLILFEYLTLLLHPYVAEITNHRPVYEMLIFVSIAAILIPSHHRFELWLIERLMRKRHLFTNGKIRLKKSKIKIKDPST